MTSRRGPQTAGGATDTKDATVVALFTNVSNPSQDFVTDDPTGNTSRKARPPW